MTVAELFCTAINQKKCLHVYYDGHDRVIEAHAVGYTKDGNTVARIWQVSGGSVSGSSSPWRLMRLDRVTKASLSEQISKAPRDGYKRGDSAMEKILCEV